jgi:outer membrane protein OmpA-like peptidoglycan-associated protein
MRGIAGWMLLGGLGLIADARAEDCALGQRYLALAKDRIASFANDEAIAFLQKSVEVCPTYEVYEELGEQAAQSSEREYEVRAVDAFVSAHELAPSDQARATSLYNYASLLNRVGDPGNAYPLIRNAQTLDPTDTKIAQLSENIENQIQHPTEEHIRAGLWTTLYKPLRVASVTKAAQSVSSQVALGVNRETKPEFNQGPSYPIPINFETGSVMVDEETRSNIAKLAHGLDDPAHAEQRFLFVGHADIRGNEAQNVILSKRRAESIYESVVTLAPSLQGRIEVTGRGSSEPIDPAHNEDAYRANRRLQVLLK